MKNQSNDSNPELHSAKLNLKAILKISQEISDEIFKENLFIKIIKTSTDFFDATKAILLLFEEDILQIRAIKNENILTPLIVEPIYYKNSKDLSIEIIDQVLKSNEFYAINKLTKESVHTNDYLKNNRVKSLLCYPILYGQKLLGVLYLENCCKVGVFSESMIEIIGHLTSQISISLKNAFFYSEMEKRLLERTEEIEQQIEENSVQNEHLKLINKDLEEKNSEITQQRIEIQEQKQHLEIKNHELEKLSIAAQKTDNAILIANKNGEIEWVNEGFVSLYGYTLPEYKIERGSTLLSTSDYFEISEVIKDCIENKNTVNYTAYSNTRLNKKIWVHTTITPILTQKGEIYKLVAIDSDISKLKSAEEEILKQKEEIEAQRDLANEQNKQINLQNKELENHQKNLEKLVGKRTAELKIAKEKAEESDRLKSSFLANMSHEIRTPMNAIIGFSDLISDPNIDQSLRNEFKTHLNSNCNSLLHLIDDIIDIARIEAGQLRIFKQDCFINQIIIELYDLFNETELKENKNIELIIEVESTDKNLAIITDPYRFKQVLVNLIANAIKFTDHGFIKFGYQISPEGHPDFIQFFVQDSGIGINKDEQKNIFEQFRKIDFGGSNKLYRGAGLGLAISKTLIEELGGKIWFESESGIGSTFYFILPFIKADKEPAPFLELTNYDWKNKTILIAEDEESNIKMLKLVLQKTNVNIVHVQNGKDAITKCSENKNIDLVLLDIKMPKLNGLDATREIRKFNKKIPIIAFTAYAMPSDQQNAKQAGCSDFIAKPIKKDDLLKKLNHYLCN